MNFSNLQYFVTVADELNVTKAAELMNLSDGEKNIINKAFDKVKIKL